MRIAYTLKEINENTKALEIKAKNSKNPKLIGHFHAAIKGLKQSEVYKEGIKNETT